MVDDILSTLAIHHERIDRSTIDLNPLGLSSSILTIVYLGSRRLAFA